MRRYILLVVCLCLVSLLHAQNRLELVSPNGELKVSLNLSDKIYYSIYGHENEAYNNMKNV
ncbi:hypothetical protein [Bacteroides acidifaciens]|uniref:hypothetical protein n=1 Tax=Bacteroides acidifaciens TaxID=85831 RepID=UPI00138F045E|nr:hypothetical protein [Bacteroides acidifaciens]NDO55235.1 hypothetical protein [Bacteroides acidifaciens]